MVRGKRSTLQISLIACLTLVVTTGCLDAPISEQEIGRTSTANVSTNSGGGSGNDGGGTGNSGGGSANDSGNSPPDIKGAPPNSIKVGDALNFQPSAGDPDGDSLSFKIENKPGWAQFDSRSGRLSGTPLMGNEGEYDNIRIIVSDGKISAAMSFSISVTAIGTASVTLSWTPPTQNEDGTVLTDLAGYFIYYGQSPDDFTDSIHVDNPSISTYVIGGLAQSAHYFVATSYNSKGFESRLSNVSKKVAE